jgi:hypothetical protein
MVVETWRWVVVAGIDAITTQVNIIFIKLQAKNLLVSQQSAELDRLASLICIQVGVDGPHSEDDIAELNHRVHFISSRWSVSHYNVVKYLFDQGTFVKDLFIPLEPPIQSQVISMVGQLILDVVVGITQIQAERTSNNNPGDDLPPTLSHELVKIRGSAFGNIVSTHLAQLQRFWTPESIADLERNHNKLVSAYQNEPVLQPTLDACHHTTSFEEAWSIVEGRFDILRDFCGGIATKICKYCNG